jgi:tRNA U38,U39,U40 pseudouridine synthase TruA
VVTRVDLMDQEWDARSSAVGRSYLYRLVTGGDTRTSLVFERDTRSQSLPILRVRVSLCAS